MNQDSPHLSIDMYQQLALITWKKQPKERAILNAALGLGEAGEIQNLVKQTSFHGHDLDTHEIALELGDLLYYIAVMSIEIGLTLSEIAEMNIAKLSARYPEGFDSERSINRDE